LPEINTTAPLRRLQGIPRTQRQPARTVKLESHPVIPLLIGHLEQIDLRNCPGDVKQGVDPAETLQGAAHDSLRRRRFSQVKIEHESLGAGGFDLRCRVIQVLKIPRNKRDGGKVACQPNCRRAADTLACPGHDRYGLGHDSFRSIVCMMPGCNFRQPPPPFCR
jgi:hypothetical protein